MQACRRRFRAPGQWGSDLPGDRWKCDEAANEMRCDESVKLPVPGSPMSFPETGVLKAEGLWCQVDIPPPEWSLKRCPSSGDTVVKVLTYNLFWWNLFNIHDGSDRSAGRLMERTSGDASYDFMGFQECEDVGRVLSDAGMSESYTGIDGGSAVAMAYRHSRWTMLDHKSEFVGEDSRDQYYGKRRAMWARFQSIEENTTAFFMNHHGPLKVSKGGGCTGSATSLNIMRVIAQNAREDDVIILLGDFNARPQSSRIQEMNRRLYRVYSGTAIGGVDHVYSNCPDHASGHNLGKGDGNHGSDHDALSVTFRV
jgi:endonuclease/exonuclease/phosphatase family metal-dependent hydrolase